MSKACYFLRRLEEIFGRERFDNFLRGYFNQFAFNSIVTGDFVDYLQNNLLDPNPDLAARINVDEWLTEPGLPKDTPQPKSDALVKVEIAAKEWADGKRDDGVSSSQELDHSGMACTSCARCHRSSIRSGWLIWIGRSSSRSRAIRNSGGLAADVNSKRLSSPHIRSSTDS